MSLLATVPITPSQNGRTRHPAAGAFLALGLLMMAGGCVQTREAFVSPSELKQLSIEELMSLEVTSVSRRPEVLSEVASAIQVITGEAIQRSGASSLPEALRLASNLQAARLDTRQWAITARGFNSALANKLLVMIDGRSVYSPLFAGTFWDVQQVFLEDVERIEVISGPGGSLWGVNAVNGVINIITKSAKDTQGLFLEAGGGTSLHGFGGARYGATLAPGLYMRAYGQYSNRVGLIAPFDQELNWGMGQGGFRMDWDASDADLLTLQGDLYRNLLARPGDDLASTGGHVLGQWLHTLPDGSTFKLQLYFDGIHRVGADQFDDLLYTYDLDFQHRFLLGARNDIVWGGGYRQIEDDFRPGALAFVPQRMTLQTFSAFVQDEIALAQDRLYLTLGTKLEHTEYTGLELQPNARLAWTPDARQILWAAVSRAVRTPSRLDRNLRAPNLYARSSFESENLVAYELGYRIQPLTQLFVSLATFYHDYNDLRSVEPANPPDPLPLIVGNGQEGESYGAELTASYQMVPWWSLRASYTMLQVDIRYKEPSDGPREPAGAREAADSEHHVMLHSSLDLPARVVFDTMFRYVSPITNPVLSLPGYAELDVRLAWQPVPDLELSVVGRNLLHDRHIEFVTPGAPIERSVYGKVAWRW